MLKIRNHRGYILFEALLAFLVVMMTMQIVTLFISQTTSMERNRQDHINALNYLDDYILTHTQPNVANLIVEESPHYAFVSWKGYRMHVYRISE